MDCIFCSIKNAEDSTFIKDFGNWILRINPFQFLLGVCVLVHKDHKEGLTSLSEPEVIEAFSHLKAIELSLQRSFSPDWFNYLQTNNNVRHLHFHIVPRYKNPVKFLDEEFIDVSFNAMPTETTRQLSEETMQRLIAAIKTNI